MKSLRLRLACWFGLSFVALLLLVGFLTLDRLVNELHHKNWSVDHPDHPDWKIHGSFSANEVQDIVEGLTATALLWGVPFAAAAFLVGWWLARQSLQRIARVNDTLPTITHRNLNRQIPLAQVDNEFQPLVRNINDLMNRLHGSFAEMSQYAAKVAHELRTPLAILRLKVENAGDKIKPELAEELQTELHRLAHVVDQSLLIAKAEQGRLVMQIQPVNLSALVAEVVEDFKLLAQAEDREMCLKVDDAYEIKADPKYVRQIIHNLLTNALKHGQCSVWVRLSGVRNRVRLTVINQVRLLPSLSDHTLGLGLRVVSTLLSQHHAASCRIRRGQNYYAIQLSFPLVAAPSLVHTFDFN